MLAVEFAEALQGIASVPRGRARAQCDDDVKQILQNLSTGATGIEEVPCPAVRPGYVLIRTTASLVSAGTERMLVQFGKASLIDKARQQPDKVATVLDKIRTDGLFPTLEAVRRRLDQPVALGYCNVGRVIAIGEGVEGISIGDRVASNGKHAQIVAIPKNLCARIPETVGDEAAAFTVVGAIALQGIRLAAPTLGENVVVIGLGLIGLLAVQLLRAHGCRVLGIDLDPARIALAQRLGAQCVDLSRDGDPLASARSFSRGRGVDAVLIAATTQKSEPVHQAAAMCRKRGRIVLVGVSGLQLSRADFYEKELSFQVSCSYGPGRYDPQYELGGHDYPAAFVRWTEQRNFEAVLDMLAEGRLQVAPLVSHRFPFASAEKAYELLTSTTSSLGIVLQYSDEDAPTAGLCRATIRLPRTSADARRRDGVFIGVIGSGSYATQTLIPALASTAAVLKSVASQDGVSAAHAGRKYGFEQSTTDARSVLDHPHIDAVVVATRHDSHARYVCEAVRAGKHVFVEKPLAIRREELAEIEASVDGALAIGRVPLVMVGFNRRFAPHVRKIRELLAPMKEPRSFVMTVNAGAVPAEHWTRDPKLGGGRIVGEACHFVDLLRFLAGAPVRSVEAMAARGAPDVATITLRFDDGSLGTIHYFANGHRSFPKERLDVFCGGRILQLDNFRTLRGFGWSGFSAQRLWRQDKGQNACIAAFVEAVRGAAPSPIPFDELIEVARVTMDVGDQLR